MAASFRRVCKVIDKSRQTALDLIQQVKGDSKRNDTDTTRVCGSQLDCELTCYGCEAN